MLLAPLYYSIQQLIAFSVAPLKAHWIPYTKNGHTCTRPNSPVQSDFCPAHPSGPPNLEEEARGAGQRQDKASDTRGPHVIHTGSRRQILPLSYIAVSAAKSSLIFPLHFHKSFKSSFLVFATSNLYSNSPTLCRTGGGSAIAVSRQQLFDGDDVTYVLSEMTDEVCF